MRTKATFHDLRIISRLFASVRPGARRAARAKGRLLVWIAAGRRPWVTSGALSAVGLVAMVAAGLSFAALRWTPWSAAIVASLTANWFGDSLDGPIAGVR